jgi:hypothetical protein
MSIKNILPLFLFALVLEAHPKAFTFPMDTSGNQEIEIEADAYYSAVDYIFSITQAPIPQLDPSQESGVYSYLFTNMLLPRYALIELSVNPLPLAGTMLKEKAPNRYEKANIGSSGLNMVTALTTGFPEPWAMSYFIGNVVDLVAADSAHKVTGKGYGGALLSLGNYHILDNHLIPDYWAEGELKLKGSAIQPDRRMSWSFRIGGKIHTHPDIFNILYFSVKRDRVDLKEPLSWNLLNLVVRNSEIEARADIRIPRSFEVWNYFTRFFLLAGKKWPSASGNWAFSLSAGTQLQLENGYRGQLAARIPGQQWSFILRPNIVF